MLREFGEEPDFELADLTVGQDQLEGGDLDLAVRGSAKGPARVLAEGYDAVFIGSGAPRGRDLDIPGRRESAAHIHIGIDWLANVSFGHTDKIGRLVKTVQAEGAVAVPCILFADSPHHTDEYYAERTAELPGGGL